MFLFFCLYISAAFVAVVSDILLERTSRDISIGITALDAHQSLQSFARR